ncbi:MAG: hypothetical protein ABEJ73_07910 [Haloplanus sp.]
MRIAAPLLALLVFLAGTSPAVALAEPAPSPTADAGVDPSAMSPAARPVLVGPSVARIDTPAVTEFYVAPDPGGSARWIVSIRYNLTTEADRAAFDRYGRAFEAGDAAVGLDAGFFRTLAAEASRATGRQMAIRNLSRNATIHNETGVLRLSFTWTNFVTDTDAGFVVEDAVLMPGNRTWLSSIGPSQRLIVDTPPGYQVTDTRFGLNNGSVVVDGPHTFRKPLSISYQQTATEEPSPDSGLPWALIGGVLLGGLALLGAFLYVRRRGAGAGEPTPDTGGEAGAESAEPAPDEATEAEQAPEAGERPDETTEGAAAPDTGEGGDETDVDPALLSDEERVEYLLDQNGGRMKQARIVRETGWSDAKVSQLLSTMADEGRIEKLRLGRENLISLPDEEP